MDKDMINSSSSAPSDALSVQQTEKQLWEIVRSIPGLNVTYGTIRCIVYIIKKNDEQTADSAIGAAKGAIQTAAITAGVITTPITIPIAGGALTGIAAKSVSETAEVIVFFLTNTEQFHGKSSEERERVFYDKIKNITGIGALYSTVRVPIYLLKKNRQQTVESGINVVTNSGGTAVRVGISMIPNIDEQLQKLMERTARSAIKHLAKKVMNQVNRENLPLEQGLTMIAKVENDCQTILEATTGQTEELLKETISSSSQIQTDVKKERKSLFRRCCCCCSPSARGKVRPQNSQDAPIPQNFADPTTNITSQGHLLILTE